MRFATGRLPFAPRIVVSAHLEGCESCREKVAALEEAEGRLLASLAPVAMSPNALDRALARLDEPQPVQSGEPRTHVGDVRLPAAVGLAGVHARRWLGPGLWAAHVRTAESDGWRAFILRAPAGTAIPTHAHGGGEMIEVLSGAFRDGDRFQAGDFAENIAGGAHRLQVEDDGPCACLIAMQGRVQWRGWGRIIAPVLGI